MRPFALLGALMLLTGCTTTHYRNWVHPEYGQTDFDRDWYECQQENSLDYNMARACLGARGWRPVSKK